MWPTMALAIHARAVARDVHEEGPMNSRHQALLNDGDEYFARNVETLVPTVDRMMQNLE